MSKAGKKLGQLGEDIAVSYLTNQGYKILERNYYTRYGEIDIICMQGKIIVFVEVRTKSSLNYGSPEESITPRKIEHLRKAALIYLGAFHLSYEEIRFDVIAIMLADNARINHIPNAF
ncbi:MAG TPA: YraN family protein [Syntrophomonadaceae bacterium]|nr:YraN family protein [Syntrophomonadaceae bacterium]